jgi:hypothetical protein
MRIRVRIQVQGVFFAIPQQPTATGAVLYLSVQYPAEWSEAGLAGAEPEARIDTRAKLFPDRFGAGP